MEIRSGNEIREAFLRFFESKGHRRVHSSSLVPANDPTLLFTNAGMNQFKDLFLGAERRDYSRATTSQKCVRAGGKHNDLENVGFTRRHHTFFEMLGNFSFGDYFKKEAIGFAWELVTSPEWFGIPKDRLYVTIFEGADGVPRDTEAENFWIEAGVAKERIKEYGLKDNFWQMGETGPCGPCSEIFYDMGMEAAETPGVDKPFGQDEARYVEIWNLVFMQFDRVIDHYECTEHHERFETLPFICDQIHSNGDIKHDASPVFRLDPLPKPSIDTGMGLERVAAVLQGKVSNFETDLFTPLIEKAWELVCEGNQSELMTAILSDSHKASLRIIADHARAATFLINDAVLPSNDGRGYVLRKILRRGIRHGRKLGQKEPFLNQMVYAVRDLMQCAYPELIDSVDRVAKVILSEEKHFSRVMLNGSDEWNRLVFQKGIEILKKQYEFRNEITKILPPEIAVRLEVQKLDGPEDPSRFDSSLLTEAKLDLMLGRPLIDLKEAIKDGFSSLVAQPLLKRWQELQDERPVVLGTEAFHLYETFGLPLDFMVDAARDAGVAFDEPGFEAARAEEQARARASWKGGSQKSASPAYRELPKTDFLGYKRLIANNAEVLAIVKDGVGVPAANVGDLVDVVLDQTSFYGDSGGQTGDTGWFTSADGNTTVAEIEGAVLPVQGVRAHKALLKENLAVGDHVRTVVDGERRDAIRRNHTGTHLLHAALRQVLGTHVKQAGSAVHPDRLRFDFSHFAQVADEELEEIESIVNREVLADARVETLEDVPIDVAVNEYHAMALFGEKYGDKVRVVKLSDGFSTELCGGTHTRATGEIGLIKIVSEGSVSSGVRRLEAISGMGALDVFRQDFAVSQIVTQLAPPAEGTSLSDSFRAKLATQEDELKRLRRELEEARMKSAAGALDEALARGVDVKGVRLVTLRADSLERGQLRTLVDNLKQKLGEGVVVLASAQPEGKVALIAGVTAGVIKRIQAGKLVGAVAKLVGGSGGGKAEIAEAGGKDQAQIDAALKAVPGILGELLG
ncbi:MAG: alanine--tRNA ligase [Terracidiphilus sp.]|jgi:alanyl-tRNA synthetase